jgi:tRNA modification GTPase
MDTAGLREAVEEPIERMGIDRAYDAAAAADLVLWLGAEGCAPAGPRAWEIDPRIDCSDRIAKRSPDHAVSSLTGEGLARLREAIVAHARGHMIGPGFTALSERQHQLLAACRDAVQAAGFEGDPLLMAEQLRRARVALDRLVGRSGTENMLDALFGRFCIGK